MKLALCIAAAWLLWSVVVGDTVASTVAHVDSVLWDSIAAAVNGH